MSELQWIVPHALLEHSISVMRPNGAQGNEGLVLWFGCGDEQRIEITHAVEVYGPGFVATPVYMSLSMRAMASLTEFADRQGLFLAGQIHSHPEDFVDLSTLDESHGIRSPDYLSVVCPYYAQRAVPGFRDCGVHIFEQTRYRRLRVGEVSRRIISSDAALIPMRLEVFA